MRTAVSEDSPGRTVLLLLVFAGLVAVLWAIGEGVGRLVASAKRIRCPRCDGRVSWCGWGAPAGRRWRDRVHCRPCRAWMWVSRAGERWAEMGPFD